MNSLNECLSNKIAKRILIFCFQIIYYSENIVMENLNKMQSVRCEK